MSVNSLASQLDALAQRVRETSTFVSPEVTAKGVTKPTSLYCPPAKKFFPPRNVFLSKTFPYTEGSPDPEQAVHTPGTAQGSYFNIESYGDARRGRLSVGVSAGIIKDADWTGQTFYSELPDRWLLGDAITSSASITQISALPHGIHPGSYINADVGFAWDAMYPASFPTTEDLLFNAIDLTPGTSASALGGLVAASAMVEMTISLLSGSGDVLSSGTASQNILNVGVDAVSYGNGVQDKVAAPFLFLDFAFFGNPLGTIDLQARAPFKAGANQVSIETSVRLVGLRGGVNDPNGGWVIAAFQDIYEGASPVSFIPFSPNPFLVRRITAFSTPF